MSDQGPFSNRGQGTRATPDPPQAQAARTEKYSDEGGRYGVRYLFYALFTIFTSVPTTIFLAWVIIWGTVILYLCTLAFAVSTFSLVGLSMFVYGPVLLLCFLSAMTCSILYNLGMYIWDTFHGVWLSLSQLKDQVSAPFSTSFRMQDGEESAWRWWSPFADKQARSPRTSWASPTTPANMDWNLKKSQTFSASPAAGSELAMAHASHGSRKGRSASESPIQSQGAVHDLRAVSPEVKPYRTQ